MLTAFLLDDEPLAVRRLKRLIDATGAVEVSGTGNDPVTALPLIESLRPDLLFLDIEMPEMNGFQMLAKLVHQPLVVFTTAYDQYALEAFRVNSIDYLLKPVEAKELERVLHKIEHVRATAGREVDLREIVTRLAAARPQYPDRIASRTGDRVEFIELARVTHFFANEKLTYAATAQKNHVVDHTIQELERKLDPRKFVRVHRSNIVNTEYVHELHAWFAGRAMVRLKDDRRTEITVSRDRVKMLRAKLGI